MKWMVDYRYITHLNCIMKRHTWVSFRELKYQCQWTQYRHIPQHWLTPVKYVHFTVCIEACATAASLWISWTELNLDTLQCAAVPSAVTVQLQSERRWRGSSFWEQQAELSSSYRRAMHPQRRGSVPLHRERVTEVLQMEARINGYY